MIRATGLSLRRGTKLLLDNTDFVIHPGERVGLVGRNGAGKTTLFALLQGRLDQDGGDLDMPQSWQIASVEQEIHATPQPAREFVIDGDVHLRRLQQQREQTSDNDGQAIAELETALADAGAWSAESRAEQLLAGLGFTPAQWTAPVNSFSGGWQMRLALARALMAPSDLLLLDEPTNHLDLDAMLWLERWLAAYAGTVVLISHDTEFLNAVSTAILHIEHQKLTRYRGDYDGFLSQRAERLSQQEAAWTRQSQEAARLQSFIDRFKAKATKAKQAQSRVKALARMTALAPLHREAGIDIRLPEPDSMPDPLLRLDNVAIGYQQANGETRRVVEDVTLMVRAASRIGVLGVNGAGKSTLIKTLAGELPALDGSLQAAKGLQIGYFAQHQLDMLDPDATPLQHMARLAPQSREQDLRNYLGGFGFGGEQALAPVAPMSGGEKARLALALVVWRKPNLLLLDEPSNHLDVDTREALASALAQFEGSVLLVSHDRHLLRTTVDQFWIVVDGEVQQFDGDLDDYRDWLQARSSAQKAQARNDATQLADGDNAPNRKALRREQAQVRQQLAQQRKPLERELAKVETDMARTSERLAELDAHIADPAFYTDTHRDERPALLAEHGELSKRNDNLEGRWLELQQALEELV